MENIVESFPDRPITSEEVEEIKQHDRVVDVENVMGVVVSDEEEGYWIDAVVDPLNREPFDYHLDLIIETESSIGIAAYPKEEFPPPEQTGDKSVIEIISVPDGEWIWISKGRKPDYDIENGLWELEEYRDLGQDGREAFETMIEIPSLRVLIRNKTGFLKPLITLLRRWLRSKISR